MADQGVLDLVTVESGQVPLSEEPVLQAEMLFECMGMGMGMGMGMRESQAQPCGITLSLPHFVIFSMPVLDNHCHSSSSLRDGCGQCTSWFISMIGSRIASTIISTTPPITRIITGSSRVRNTARRRSSDCVSNWAARSSICSS